MTGILFGLRGALAIVLLALLAACGGSGGSDSAEPGAAAVEGTTITAVDPYIVGAVFQEIDVEGNLPPRQISEPSGEDGLAVFAREVLAGSTIEMIQCGRHGDAPFTGTLKRVVGEAGSSFVVSPLTTLAAELGERGECLAGDEACGNELARPILEAAGLSLADITADPMAALEGYLDPGPEQYAPMILNLAVNAALNMLEPENPSWGDVVRGVVSRLLVDDDEDDIPDVVNAMYSVDGAGVDDCVSSFAVLTDSLIGAVARAEEAGPLDADEIADLLADVPFPNIPELMEAATQGAVAIDSHGDIVIPLTTVRDFLDEGYESLDQFNAAITSPADELLAAAHSFQAAKHLIGTDVAADQADLDEARFFGSLAELVLLAKPYSDFTANGLNNLGDILDAFGIDPDRDTRGDLENLPTCNLPAPIPATPDSGEFQQALATMLLGRLQTLADDLDLVSSAFEKTQAGIEYDYSDALFIKGLAQAMYGQINLLMAYNLDFDLNDTSGDDSLTAEEFLAEYTEVGSLAADYAIFLAVAKTHLSRAADSLLAAMSAVEAESDTGVAQYNDLITFYADNPDDMAADILDVKAALGDFKASLSSAVTFNEGTECELTLNLSRIFTGIDLRELTPDFVDDVPSMFPDPTMGGIIVDEDQLDINADEDHDGRPDLLCGYTDPT